MTGLRSMTPDQVNPGFRSGRRASIDFTAQTSFKALEETILFAGETGHTTALLDKLRQRGGINAEGRQLYDDLLRPGTADNLSPMHLQETPHFS